MLSSSSQAVRFPGRAGTLLLREIDQALAEVVVRLPDAVPDAVDHGLVRIHRFGDGLLRPPGLLEAVNGF